jgi:ABC-2 type transport system permease protein
MNEVLEAVSNVLPLTFSVDALQQVATNTEPTDELWMDAGVIVAIVLAVLVLASLTLRRRTA